MKVNLSFRRGGLNVRPPFWGERFEPATWKRITRYGTVLSLLSKIWAMRFCGSAFQRPVLQVMIERQDQKSIALEDCVRVSKAVCALFDVANPLKSAYTQSLGGTEAISGSFASVSNGRDCFSSKFFGEVQIKWDSIQNAKLAPVFEKNA